jgi:hypothetical protein
MGEIKAVLDASKQLAAQKYDVQSKIIKRAYFMNKAFDKLAIKRFTLRRFEKRTIKFCQKLWKVRADDT